MKEEEGKREYIYIQMNRKVFSRFFFRELSKERKRGRIEKKLAQWCDITYKVTI